MNKTIKSKIDKFLLNVQKPAGYIGGELNSIVKKNPPVRIAVSYPDLYEVGMSNNGIRILYDIANNIDDAACERVFAVAGDFEKILRKEDIPLYTLESFTPLMDLDLVGFNLAHELLYTNILQILDLGKIPLFVNERKDGDPIIMAGGDSASNPFPMKKFIDAFYLGDGEEGFVDVINVLLKGKRDSLKRNEIVDLLDEIDGVMVSSKYKLTYNGASINKVDGKTVKRRINSNEKLLNPLKPLVPNIRIVQERAVYEITKGCGNLCKFCHAGFYHLPYRHIPHEGVCKEILSIVNNTGYDEVSFSSLSISDYQCINNLLNAVMPQLTERGISISLPSLKVDKRTIPIIEQVSDLRKTSLTFAVESASEEIRGIANKKVNTEELLTIVDYLSNNGWRLVKLYFMIGLPGCGEFDEAESIILLLKDIIGISKKKLNVNVTLSPFVPKPHTPFEREKQVDAEYFHNTILKIKRGVPSSVKIKNHDVNSSILEGVLSRGDDRLCDVIHSVYLLGCRFDSWKEHFKYDVWKNKLDEIIPGWEKLLENRNNDDILPWSIIQTGYENVKISMNQRAMDLNQNKIVNPEYKEPLNLSELQNAVNKFEKKFIVEKRIRVHIKKRGNAKYIPHIDFIEIIKRSLRMASVPVAFTRGFNKREKLSMGFPLPVGIGSDSELCDIDLFDEINSDICDSLSQRLPEGIDVINWHYVEKKESLMAITNIVEYTVGVESDELYKKIVKSIDEKIDFVKVTKKQTKTVFFNEAVYSFKINEPNGGNLLKIGLYCGTPCSIRIDKVLLSLSGVDFEEFYRFRVVKIGQYRLLGNKLAIIE